MAGGDFQKVEGGGNFDKGEGNSNFQKTDFDKGKRDFFITVHTVPSPSQFLGRPIINQKGSVRVWDVETFELLQTINIKSKDIFNEYSRVTELVWDIRWFNLSPSGLLAYRGCIWNIWTGNLLHKLQPPDSYSTISFLPDGKRFMIYENCWPKFWDLSTGKLLTIPKEIEIVNQRRKNEYEGYHKILEYSPDGGKLLAATERYGENSFKFEILDIPTQHWVTINPFAGSGFTSYAWSSDGSIIAFAVDTPYGWNPSTRSGVQLWDTGTGKLIRTLKAPFTTGPIRDIVFSPDGNILVVKYDGEYSDTIVDDDGDQRRERCHRIWDFKTGKILHRTDFGGKVYFSSNGNKIAWTWRIGPHADNTIIDIDKILELDYIEPEPGFSSGLRYDLMEQRGRKNKSRRSFLIFPTEGPPQSPINPNQHSCV